MNLKCNNAKWSFNDYYFSIAYGFNLNILRVSLTLEKKHKFYNKFILIIQKKLDLPINCRN